MEAFVILCYLLLSVVVGVMAGNRGRWGLGYFLLSILISPILGLIAVLVMGPRFRGGYTIPERGPYELAVTKKQQNYLWQLGIRDRSVIDTIGRDQASDLIDQILTSGGGRSWAPYAAAAVLVPIAAVTVYQMIKPKVPAEFEKKPGVVRIDLRKIVTSEADARKEAVSRYPMLGVAGTPMNREFLARYEKAKTHTPGRLRDPSWPLLIADETAAALNTSQASR